MEHLMSRPRAVRGFRLTWEHMRYAAVIGFFLMIWFFPNPNAVSFREDPGAGREGTLMVQLLWFGILGFMILNIQDRWPDIRRQFDVTLLATLAWCAMTVPLAILPDVSMRRFIFTLVAMLTAILTVTTLENNRKFLYVMFGIIVVETVYKYVMVFAFPSVGRHGFLGLEPQLNGLWRGQFAHKNVAGPVIIMELFILYACRRFIPRPYLLMVAALQVLFLINSGSKTSMGLFALVFLMSNFLTRSRNMLVNVSLVFFLIFAVNGLTLFTIFSDLARQISSDLTGDATFTGRTDVWYMLVRYVADNPLLGTGFLSFWQIGFLSPASQDSSTWVSVANYGHQGYLDLAATIGIPGVLITLLFIGLRPALDLTHIRNRTDPALQMYISFWLFGLLHNGTESNILGRADNVWLFLVMGVAGIRRQRCEAERVG